MRCMEGWSWTLLVFLLRAWWQSHSCFSCLRAVQLLEMCWRTGCQCWFLFVPSIVCCFKYPTTDVVYLYNLSCRRNITAERVFSPWSHDWCLFYMACEVFHVSICTGHAWRPCESILLLRSVPWQVSVLHQILWNPSDHLLCSPVLLCI